MAIRFQCSSCTQPIEVDDEWGSRPVACPYCHETVIAPVESTLADTPPVPVASPLSPVDGLAPATAPLPSPPGGPNRVATVALALACCLLVLLGAYVAVTVLHQPQIEEFQEEIERLESNSGSLLQAMTEYVDSHGGVLPRWLVLLSMLQFAMLGLWIATIICAAIGMRHRHRRKSAVVAAVISGIAPILLCCSWLLQAPPG